MGKIFTLQNISRKDFREEQGSNYIVFVDPSALRGADYFAICRCFKKDGMFFFDDFFSTNTGTKAELAEVILRIANEKNADIYVERNGIINIDFCDFLDENGIHYTPIVSTQNKFDKITSNYERLTKDCVFSNSPIYDYFFEQIYDFSEKVEHDDNIDCVVSAIDVLRKFY